VKELVSKKKISSTSMPRKKLEREKEITSERVVKKGVKVSKRRGGERKN